MDLDSTLPTEPIEPVYTNIAVAKTLVGLVYTFRWNGDETVSSLMRFIEKSGGPTANKQKIYHLIRGRYDYGDLVYSGGVVGKLTSASSPLVSGASYYMQPKLL